MAQLNVLFIDHTAIASGAELALASTVENMTQFRASILLYSGGHLADRFRRSTQVLSWECLPEELLAATSPRLNAGTIAKLKSVTQWLAATPSIVRAMRRLSPDIVVLNSLKSVILTTPALLIFRKPTVMYLRDDVSPGALGIVKAAAVALAARYIANATIANSSFTLQTLSGSHRRSYKVIPSPVAPPQSHWKGSTYDPANAECEPFAVAHIGRIAAWKGQHIAIKAFASAFEVSNAVLHIVGGPLFGEVDYQRSLHQLVSELRLDERVIFHGHVDDPYKILEKMHCLVHTSIRPEPFGQVVVQGMAAGLVTIASAAGGPSETIIHGESGILFPPNDVISLATILRDVRNNWDHYESIRQNARLAAERYAPQSTVRELEHFLASLLD